MTTFLLSLPIWFINGALYILYGLSKHIAEIVSLLVGLVIAFSIDPHIQARASDRPRRYERGTVHTAVPSGSYFTLVVLGIWITTSFISKQPIPLIGAVMWTIGFLGILAVSEERFNQLWWVKTGMLVYAVLVLLLRFGLRSLQAASAADWAGVIGSSADAQLILERTQSNVAMVGMLFVLALYPIGYAAMLFNRFIRNPKPLYNIWREAGDVLGRLRTRK